MNYLLPFFTKKRSFRYKKLIHEIVDWETKKKKKAKHDLEKVEVDSILNFTYS